MTIAAPPSLVWDVLTDFASYPAWSSFIREITGSAREGAQLRITMVPAGRRAIRGTPRVSAAEPGRRFGWRGHLWHPLVFSTTHEFVLVARPEGTTTVLHGERFTGLLPRLLREPPKGGHEGFTAFNTALRARVEALLAA